MKEHASSGAIYGIGFLGALVFYMQHATSFWSVVMGFFYSIFWPGVMVYKALLLLPK